METRNYYCIHCRKDTDQEKRFYDPDQPELGEVWTCKECLEGIDFIGDLGELMKHLNLV